MNSRTQPGFELADQRLPSGASPVNIARHESKASLLGNQPFDNNYQASRGGYLEREGYVTSPPRAKQQPSIMYKPNSLWTWSFVILTSSQAAVVLALEAYCFAMFEESLTTSSFDQGPDAPDPVQLGVEPPKRYVYTKTIPTFLALYIFGMIYQLILVWDALRLRNTIQIIGLCMLNLGLMVYGAVQQEQIGLAIDQLSSTLKTDVGAIVKPSMIAVPCVLAVGLFSMSFLAWKLYDEFAWTIYKHISADLKMKRRYLMFQIYIALLKFDFFFFLGFTIQFLVIIQGTNTYDPEFGLTVASIPVTIIILVLAAYWTKREVTSGMIIVIVFFFLGLAYFLFKLIRIWVGDKTRFYQVAAKPLTTFAVITIVLLVATIATAIKCMTNFNKGLKPHITTRKVETEEEKAYVTEMPNLTHGPVPSRMTIE